MNASASTCDSLWFCAARRVEIRRSELGHLAKHHARVRVVQSAISAGTELLAFRDEMAPTLAIDPQLGALSGTFRYPFRYGYICVGVIEALDPATPTELHVGQRVFAFHPHASRFDAPMADVIPLPSTISDDAALFLPNMETAVTMILDAAPLLGERIAVLGQGVVGRLVTALLQRFPLAELCVLDPRVDRLWWAQHQRIACGWPHDDARYDAIVEASGAPQALQVAIDRCALEGRVIVGSWYGEKNLNLALGQNFHRHRVRLISSQVSTLPGTLSQAWSRARRWQVAMTMLQQLSVGEWITQRLPLAQAAEAYRALDEARAGWEQVALVYEHG